MSKENVSIIEINKGELKMKDYEKLKYLIMELCENDSYEVLGEMVIPIERIAKLISRIEREEI